MRLLNKGFFSIRIQKKVPSVSEANIIFICNRLLSKDFFAKFQLFFHGKKVNKLGKKVEAFKFLGDYGAINGFGAI